MVHHPKQHPPRTCVSAGSERSSRRRITSDATAMECREVQPRMPEGGASRARVRRDRQRRSRLRRERGPMRVRDWGVRAGGDGQKGAGAS